MFTPGESHPSPPWLRLSQSHLPRLHPSQGRLQRGEWEPQVSAGGTIVKQQGMAPKATAASCHTLTSLSGLRRNSAVMMLANTYGVSRARRGGWSDFLLGPSIMPAVVCVVLLLCRHLRVPCPQAFLGSSCLRARASPCPFKFSPSRAEVPPPPGSLPRPSAFPGGHCG